MDPATRAVMERRLGFDFGDIRVHADAGAAARARAVDARAFTVGRHLTFGAGEYRPRTAEGRRLLAHELVHAVQQGAGLVGGGTLPVSHPHGPAEWQAESVARGAGLGVPAAARPHVARNGGGHKPASSKDLSVLSAHMTALFDAVDAKTRKTLTTNKTIAIGLVTDSDGDRTLVYTVSGNWTNKSLRAAADKLGVTRWEATPRAEGRGKVGAPGDAEQLLFEAADTNDFKAGMAVSRTVCADCREEVKSRKRGGVPVVEVGVRPTPPTTSKKSKDPAAAEPAPEPKRKPAAKKPAAKKPAAKKPAAKKPAAKNPAVAPKPGRGPTAAPKPRAPVGPRTGAPRGSRSSAAGVGVGVGAAVVGAVASLIAQKYLQDILDEKNTEAFQRDMEKELAKLPDRLKAHEARIQALQKAGKAVFVNVSVTVRWQTDVSGELGGGTAYMGMSLGQVTVSETKLAKAESKSASQGDLGAAAKETYLGSSSETLKFSLTYPDLEMASEWETAADVAVQQCFIATACYGSPEATEVVVLRAFRDRHLLRTAVGRWFVAAYYALSPPLAAFLTRHDRCRRVTRTLLVAPVAAAVRRAMDRPRAAAPVTGRAGGRPSSGPRRRRGAGSGRRGRARRRRVRPGSAAAPRPRTPDARRARPAWPG